MNACAKNVVLQYKNDIVLAFGESDEYSFVLKSDTTLFNRRRDKISTLFVSLFTSNYVSLWSKFFVDRELHRKHLPFFDSRCVAYPNLKSIKDYLSWRFVDTHINNLYNTASVSYTHLDVYKRQGNIFTNISKGNICSAW